MIWVVMVAWAVLAGTLAIGGVHWMTKHEHKRRLQAYREILQEKGVQPKPDESIKAALLRARREERGAPSVRPPPVFARSVTRSMGTIDGRTTGHKGGHTAASIEAMPAVTPRSPTLLFPTPPPRLLPPKP